jgi:hypothetical protein
MNDIPSSDVLQSVIDLRVHLVTGCNTEAKNCVKRMYLKEYVRLNVSVRHLLFI